MGLLALHALPGAADAGERRAAGRRQEERRGVGEVEKLGAELQPVALGEFDVLEDGDIRILRSGSARHAAGGIAELLDRRARDAGCRCPAR